MTERTVPRKKNKCQIPERAVKFVEKVMRKYFENNRGIPTKNKKMKIQPFSKSSPTPRNKENTEQKVKHYIIG